jgi:hypothetical protein
MKRIFKNWFYKDSHLVIKKKANSMPDGGAARPIVVKMLTFSPYQTKEVTLNTTKDSVDLTGTYGLNPLDIFNPFKTNTNIVWLMMYQQGLIKDVTAELIHKDYGSVVVTVNNPQVGKPYAAFYNSPIEAAIPSPLAGTKLYLGEGDSNEWISEKGWRISVTRNNDNDNKEFIITA